MTKKKKLEELVGAGRPTSMTDEIVKKFLSGFRMGFNDIECCAYCQISRPTYYDYIKKHPEFLAMVNEAKEQPFLKAKAVIEKAIERGDTNTAKWYLEKRRKEEFGDVKKIELETSNKFAEMSASEKAKALLELEEK